MRIKQLQFNAQLNEKLIEWREMTDWNRHGKVREDIAKFFNCDKSYELFKAINTIHNHLGLLPTNLFNLRCDLTDKMLSTIERAWDKGIRRSVESCL